MPHTWAGMTTGTSTPTVESVEVPNLTAPDRWATLAPTESAKTAAFRHIVAETRSTSACGVTAIPATMWRTARHQPVCPDCAARFFSGEPHDPALHGRTVVSRRSVRGQGSQINETYYPSAAERNEERNSLIRLHVPAEFADTIIAMLDADIIDVTPQSVNIDKDGAYEDDRGSCLREIDEASMRTLTALTFSTNWLDPAKAAQPVQDEPTEPADDDFGSDS